MSWQDTLKMVRDVSYEFVNTFPPSKENPLLFLDVAELPKEQWDSEYEKGGNRSHGRSFHVKVYGKIIQPKLNPRMGFGVPFEGHKEDFKQNRFRSGKEYGKDKTVSRTGYSFIKWNITVDWAEKNNIPIPDDAPVYGNGLESGNYGQWKTGELGTLYEENRKKEEEEKETRSKEEEENRKEEETRRKKEEYVARQKAQNDISSESEQNQKEYEARQKNKKPSAWIGSGKSKRRKLGTTRGKPSGSVEKASVWFKTIKKEEIRRR